ncbi:hypothetical protein C8R42DRAFT_728191 [Lentinula raphanica]|nr:hypothetical protein C8R42DRAFT_728191 [Lentinula raphanica]
MFLRSLSALSFFACLISIATAASIPPTAIAFRTTNLHVRAPPPAAGDPSLWKQNTPSGIDLPVVLHTPSWSLRTPFSEVYLSIGDRDVTCDPRDAISRQELDRKEIGQLILPHSHSLEQMIAEACKIWHQSEKPIQKSRSEIELDYADMFMNLLVSGKYSTSVPMKLLEDYKEASREYRKTINPKSRFGYQNVVLNVHAGSAISWPDIVPPKIDMDIGIRQFSTSQNSALNTPLQPSNHPGPGKKVIGFAVFSSDQNEILERVTQKSDFNRERTMDEGKKLEKFMSCLAEESDVTLGGVLLQNWRVAMGTYNKYRLDLENGSHWRKGDPWRST